MKKTIIFIFLLLFINACRTAKNSFPLEGCYEFSENGYVQRLILNNKNSTFKFINSGGLIGDTLKGTFSVKKEKIILDEYDFFIEKIGESDSCQLFFYDGYTRDVLIGVNISNQNNSISNLTGNIILEPGKYYNFSSPTYKSFKLRLDGGIYNLFFHPPFRVKGLRTVKTSKNIVIQNGVILDQCN